MDEKLYAEALEYHNKPNPGKIATTATKHMVSQRDLALAYSPGVAAACQEILKDPNLARKYTSKRNLAAVISNGTAVLGLGDIGALASKPVMEGKAVLFKKFSGIDCFDIEVDEKDPEKFIETVARLEPTFGAINLEDIKAPDCFRIEEELKKRMNIPVFHDDQHGTAIIVCAAVRNALEIVKKKIADVKLVVSGAGAAAIACLDLLVKLGIEKKNIIMCDRSGVVSTSRSNLPPHKASYASNTTAKNLLEAMKDADIFLGVSGPRAVSKDMVKAMAKDPIILALANPIPEILPEEIAEVRDDAIVATGRTDYPNQVNNVLCFPFIFRGTLDSGATEINDAMKIAAVDAIANLAKAPASEVVADAYGGINFEFGREYLIPKPFDPRLMLVIAPAVAKAAMESGVATDPIANIYAYRAELLGLVSKSGQVMQPIYAKAKENPKRITFTEGEEPRVLRAAQTILDEGICKPILIGRRNVVETRLKRLNLKFELDKDVELVDPQDDSRYKDYWQLYHALLQRKGVMPDDAKTIVRTNNTVIGCLMVKRGDADGVIAGPSGLYRPHLKHVLNILGPRPGTSLLTSLNIIMSPKGLVFICDAFVNPDPTPEQLANIVYLASEHVKHFGLTPKIALVSHSNFGASRLPVARKMDQARKIVQHKWPDLEIDGEMQAEAAFKEDVRRWLMPDSPLCGQANLIICPNMDAANIAFNTGLFLSDSEGLGPVLLGVDKPAHIMTAGASSQDIVNMAALTAVDAQLCES